MKLRRIVPLDIENKILIPFACISLATVLCFCVILYFTEFQVKVEAERQEAQTLIGYLQADLQLAAAGAAAGQVPGRLPWKPAVYLRPGRPPSSG